MCGGVHDVITGNKFHQNRSRGFRATGIQKLGSPIDLACRPYNSSALTCWLWCTIIITSVLCLALVNEHQRHTARDVTAYESECCRILTFFPDLKCNGFSNSYKFDLDSAFVLESLNHSLQSAISHAKVNK